MSPLSSSRRIPRQVLPFPVQCNDSFYAKQCPMFVESCHVTSVPHITLGILDVNAVKRSCKNVHFAIGLRRVGTLTKR
jgi:hypothetical protein